MQFRTVEWVGYGVAIIVPVIGAIWLAASTVQDMKDMSERVDAIEADVSKIVESQIEDRLVNRRVDKLDEHVDWLRHHHHAVRGDDTGGPHTD